MAGDEAETEQTKVPRSRGGLWRDRLKEKASKLTKGKSHSALEEQNVADFLQSASTTSITSETRPNPAPPRIDTGSLGFESVSVAPEDRFEPLGFPAAQTYSRKKRAKPRNIHVSFTHEAPFVFGEGGEEAELPSSQVVGSWTHDGDNNEARPHSQDTDSGSVLEPPPAILQAGPDSRRRSSLQRAPTGGKPLAVAWALKRQSMSFEEGLAKVNKDTWTDELPSRKPTLPDLNLQLTQQHSPSTHSSPSTPAQPIEAKPYVAISNHAADSEGRGPNISNGSDTRSEFRAFNPSMRRKEVPHIRQQSDGLAPGSLSADPSKAVYPEGHKVIQSSYDNLLHHPKPQTEISSLASPGYDQYGEMPGFTGVANVTPETAAAEEFYSRMRHLRGIFRLTAERPRSIGSNDFGQWLRASLWWFTRGKTDLDVATRSQGSDRGGTGEDNLPINKQCYVDMTKAWWILEEMVPGLVQAHVPTNEVDEELDHETLLSVLQRIKWDMSRYFLKLDDRGMLPPSELLVQGADPEIWIPYPSFPPGLYALTTHRDPRTLARQSPSNPATAFSMPLNDSEAMFVYGRFFGLARILGDPALTQATLPCIVSIVRDRNQMLAKFLLTTQDGQINLHIQSDKSLGPSWSSVKWNAKTYCMLVVLKGDIAVETQLRDADFRVLYGVHDYNHKLESERLPHGDEELLFGDHVAAFHFLAPNEAKTGFPPVPVQDCKVRLFQKTTLVAKTAGSRRIFRNYRISVTSSPTSKTLSNTTRQLREHGPILYNNLRGEGGAPALALVLEEGDNPASLIFTFESSVKRAAFHTILAATATSPDECFSEDIPMHSFAISEIASSSNPIPVPLPMPQGIQWQRLKVINLGENLGEASCVFSDRLRVCMSSNFGSIADRINVGIGEIRIGLDPDDTASIKLYRPAQNNLTISFLETSVRSKDVAQLSEALAAIAERPTYRIYKFLSLPVLHDFQGLATGHAVVYDGHATHFAITRRRMFVGMHKNVETDRARIQVLRQASKILLVAFFPRFVAGRCMCFELRGTDVYETMSVSGKFAIRFVEAKFSMPRPATDDAHDMVCLDDVGPPTEHDDLVFGFDTEDGKL